MPPTQCRLTCVPPRHAFPLHVSCSEVHPSGPGAETTLSPAGLKAGHGWGTAARLPGTSRATNGSPKVGHWGPEPHGVRAGDSQGRAVGTEVGDSQAVPVPRPRVLL